MLLLDVLGLVLVPPSLATFRGISIEMFSVLAGRFRAPWTASSTAWASADLEFAWSEAVCSGEGSIATTDGWAELCAFAASCAGVSGNPPGCV